MSISHPHRTTSPLCLQGLHSLGYEIISTGGTATAIEKAGVPVKKVEDVTGFPEMLDGGFCRNTLMGFKGLHLSVGIWNVRLVMHAVSCAAGVSACCGRWRCR